MASWKPSAVALFVTMHLMCIILYLLPYPPRMDAATLALPDVREELDRFVSTIEDTFHPNMPRTELRNSLIQWVREYSTAHEQIRRVIRWYLAPTGQLQSWNMFGGTPPRRPRVVMADVQTLPGGPFEPFLDGRWGTEADAHFSFRHRKAQERLSVPGHKKERAEYAQYISRMWNDAHPDRPALAVRLYFYQLQTRSISQIRAGKAAEAPKEVESSIWPVREALPIHVREQQPAASP